MRIWIVSRAGHPVAVFSTAGSATDYVSEHGGEAGCDVLYLILDADSSHAARTAYATRADLKPPAWPESQPRSLSRH
jgi:hypothetical protein